LDGRVRTPKYFAEERIFGLEANQTRREQATRGKRGAVQLAASQNIALGAGISGDKFVFQS
jgi:hypothetical protein